MVVGPQNISNFQPPKNVQCTPVTREEFLEAKNEMENGMSSSLNCFAEKLQEKTAEDSEVEIYGELDEFWTL